MTALLPLFKTVLFASWQGSLAIGLVLLARQALGARVPARWRYLLWALVFLRLLAPAVVLPHNPASLQNIRAVSRPFEPVAPSVIEETRIALPPPAGAVAVRVAPHAPRRISWWEVAAAGWLIGAAGVATVVLASAWRMHVRLRRQACDVDPAIKAHWHDACRKLLHRPPPRLVAVDWIASPALLGIWRPTLIIPADCSFSREDWEHVFAHEIAHLRSRDHWTQLLQLAALGVHWFNPLVWIGFRCLRADRELAADEWALRQLEEGRALAYGATLLKAATTSAFQPGLVGISEDGAQMKQRLQRIVGFPPRRSMYRSLAGAAILLMLAAVVMGQKAADLTAEKKPPPPTATPPPKSTAAAEGLIDQIIAASRAGDSAALQRLIESTLAQAPSIGEDGAAKLLDQFARDRELKAFLTLLDQLKQTNLGKNWQPSDELLAGFVKDDRRDFLDALLARELDPTRLTRLGTSAAPAVAEWITRRVAEVTKQRADIEVLSVAAYKGDLPTIRRLLDAGVDPNAVGKNNNTMLIQAGNGNRLEAAQLLLDRGADPNKPRFPGWDYSPLCLVQSVPMAELLKKAGGDVHAKLFRRNVSILTYVARWSKPEVVAWFLDQGLDPKMIGDNNENLLFGLKNAGTAKLLLDRGVDPNWLDEFGATPICSARSAEVAQALIDHGAKLTGLKEPLLPKMIQFATAGAVEAVLKAQPKPNHAEVQLALMGACFGNRDETVRVLLKYGASPNEPTAWPAGEKSTMLPLTACTINPSAKCAKALLEAGADPNGGSEPGEILRNALGNHHADVVKVLREAGARGASDLACSITALDDKKTAELLASAPKFSDNAAFWDGALDAAIPRGDRRTVRAALDHGVPAGSNEIYAAASEGQPEILADFLALHRQSARSPYAAPCSRPPIKAAPTTTIASSPAARLNAAPPSSSPPAPRLRVATVREAR